VNGTVLAADLPLRATARIGDSRSSLRVLSEWGAQEKPPIDEPHHDVGPSPCDDDKDDDEDAGTDERPIRSAQALPRKHPPVKEPPQPK
jgi:hypothetical protein